MQHVTPLLPLERLNEIEELVHRSLCMDWIVRVEYTDEATPRFTRWQQWGKALFALEEAGPVLEAIHGCRASHPNRAIRLTAEKVKPETRFVYPVYQPPEQPILAVQSQRALLTATQGAANGLQTLGKRTRRFVWRLAALAGMVLASLLLVEQAMS